MNHRISSVNALSYSVPSTITIMSNLPINMNAVLYLELILDTPSCFSKYSLENRMCVNLLKIVPKQKHDFLQLKFHSAQQFDTVLSFSYIYRKITMLGREVPFLNIN